MEKKIKINLQSSDKKCLYIYIYFIKKLLKKLTIKHKLFFLPVRIKNLIFLKSPHVYKKSKEHFLYKKEKVLLTLTCKKLTWLKFFILNKPNIVKIKITIQQGR